MKSANRVSDLRQSSAGSLHVGPPGSFFAGRRLVYLRDLLQELVRREMKLKYKRSILGLLWTLLNPLAQLVVIGFVFRVIIPIRIPNYTSFLFTGLLVWGWFQASLIQATGAIVDSPELIRRPRFPAAVLPIVTVASNLIHFLMALPILFVFLVIEDIPFTIALVALPLVIALQFALTLSLSYMVATFHVSFRDTRYLLGVGLLLTFYLSPIIYDTGSVPPPYQFFYRLNPLVDVIGSYRAILLRGSFPDPVSLATLAILSAVLLWLGYRIFSRASSHFIEEL